MGRKAVGLLAAITGSVLVLVAVAPNARAAPGDLDPPFSRNGKVLLDFAGGDDGASAVAIQPDGKVVAAGFSSRPVAGRTFAVVRFDSDGTRDPSFGGDGIVTTGFGGGNASGRAIAIEPDGDIVVAGASSQPETGWDLTLARYEPDGSLDSTFGQNGRVTTDVDDGADGANALVLQPDGKIVVAGESEGDIALARYNGDGSLDTSFSGDGIATTDFAGRTDVAYAAALQGNGRILVAGSVIERDEFWGDEEFAAVARYGADGSLDPSFSGDGLVVMGFGARAYAIALQQDGKIVLGGAFGRFDLTRHNADGTRDTTFGEAGLVRGDFGTVRALGIQSDGRLVAAGSDCCTDFLVGRWHANGAVESAFGGPHPYASQFPGASTDFGLFREDEARAVAIQSDGKIVVVGQSMRWYYQPRDFAIARYRVDGLGEADADADGVGNDLDLCDRRFGTNPDGCPHYARTVTIRYSYKDRAFKGRLSTDPDPTELGYCPSTVTIYKRQRGADPTVGHRGYGPRYRVPYPRRRGWYYAKVERHLWSSFGICEGSRSASLRVSKR